MGLSGNLAETFEGENLSFHMRISTLLVKKC